jgi:hypothetical protein
MNYKLLHKAVKDAIKADGFTYVNGSSWGNLDKGIVPSAWLNKGFNIKFVGDDSPMNSTDFDKWLTLGVPIEFMLDLVNDLYLETLQDCITAVQTGVMALKAYSTGISTVMQISRVNVFTIDYYDKYLIMRFNPQVKFREV